MANRPFFVSIPITLTANGENTGEYDVGQGNTLTIKRIMQKSTGTADMIALSDSFGNNFGNLSSSNPIDINAFTDIGADNNVPADLPDPIIIEDNGRLQIRLKDTSGSGNTVYIYLFGFLTQRGG